MELTNSILRNTGGRHEVADKNRIQTLSAFKFASTCVPVTSESGFAQECFDSDDA